MKKIFYSLAIMVMGLASCTTWDDAVTEKYDAGPAVDINVMAVEPSDSVFKVTITPAAGTTYYAFLIEEGSEAKDRDGYTLLKGGYSNTVVSASEKNPTDSLFKGEPNTTYQVYAVASNDKGIIGDVVVKSITTTDKNAPKPMTLKDDPNNKAVQVTFNQAIKRGTGAVTAVYYKEWDWENPVTVAPEDIVVTISGKTVTFSVPSAPAGAFISFSWEKGAFVDEVGNQCTAFTSTYDEKTDKFIGVWVHAANEAFEVTDKNVTAPEEKEFDNWEAFEGELTFDFDIFRNDETVKDGDLSVVYTGKKRTATYKLTAEQWSVSGKKLTFKLPEAPNSEETIALKMVEGAINDVYGNPNSEYTSTITWKYSTFQPTVEDVLGTFNYSVTLKSNGNTYDLGSFTISEYTGDDAEEGDVVIRNLYLDDSEIYGYYDLEAAKLYIWRYQKMGTYEYEGELCGVLTYSVAENDLIPFDIKADGIVSTDFALAYTDPEYKELQGYEVPPGTTVFTKTAATAKKKVAKTKVSKKASIARIVKGSPKKVKAIRK